MVAWVMVLGMVSLVNVTMVGAIMQLAGNIPDGSLLVILSRYLRRKGEHEESLLLPVEASSRLRRLQRRTGTLALASCVPGLGFTLWAASVGWGAVAGAALSFWVLAGNLGFLTLPLASLARRARRMRLDEGPEPAKTAEGNDGLPPGENTETHVETGKFGKGKRESTGSEDDGPNTGRTG